MRADHDQARRGVLARAARRVDQAITDRLGNEGYAFANANAVPDVDKEKRTVAFTIFVDPGRRVYVRRINIVGNTKTRDEVIRREMRQLEGAFYDGQKLQDSRKRVDRLGYFDERRARDRAGHRHDRPGRRHVEGRRRSRPARCCSALGFSSSDKLIVQGSISQANIFGSGKAITLNANTSKVNRNLGLAYTNPYFTVDGVSARLQRLQPPLRRARARRSATTPPRRSARACALGFPISELDRDQRRAWRVEQTKIETFERQPAVAFVDVRRLRTGTTRSPCPPRSAGRATGATA